MLWVIDLGEDLQFANIKILATNGYRHEIRVRSVWTGKILSGSINISQLEVGMRFFVKV